MPPPPRKFGQLMRNSVEIRKKAFRGKKCACSSYLSKHLPVMVASSFHSWYTICFIILHRWDALSTSTATAIVQYLRFYEQYLTKVRPLTRPMVIVYIWKVVRICLKSVRNWLKVLTLISALRSTCFFIITILQIFFPYLHVVYL
jgi:hypothetical protein